MIHFEKGADAIHAAADHSPRVMFVDILLPDMNGKEVVQRVSRIPSCADTCIIFLTSLAPGVRHDGAPSQIKIERQAYRSPQHRF